MTLPETGREHRRMIGHSLRWKAANGVVKAAVGKAAAETPWVRDRMSCGRTKKSLANCP